MAITIGANISSLSAQRMLAYQGDTLSRLFERLASGSRINRASDDAAGLAVAASLNRDGRVLSQALRNINDGISVINIADSALNQQKSLIERLRELAEQSANGVYDDRQRRVLAKEYNSLVWEFGRIGDSSVFNGIFPLLGGKSGLLSQLNLQVGANGSANSSLAVNLSNMGTYSGKLQAVNFTQNFSGFDDSFTFEGLQDAYDGRLIRLTVTDTAGVERELLAGLVGNFVGGSLQSHQLVVYQRVEDTGTVGQQTSAGTIGQILDGGHEWVLGGRHTSAIVLNTDTAEVITGVEVSLNFSFNQGDSSATLNIDLRSFDFTFGNDSSSLHSSGIESVDAALQALELLSRRAQEVSTLQGSFGAVQSRLNSLKLVTESLREETAAAESRIKDSDIAFESAAYVRTTIVQQVAASVLAQANLQPQLALSLLQ